MTSVAVRPDPARTTHGVSAETAETGRLFEEHSGQLLAYCARRLGSRAEAEDAVQTTFLYALRALRRGVVPECEVAWLTTIAKNVCHGQRRTRARRGPLASVVDLDTVGLIQPDGDEEGLLLGLKDALASIPDSQRRALVLREWQGVPPREIATRLGMTTPATYALLTRARRSLAQALTSARRPVLGVAWLVVELRSHVKALLGGASAKAAATTAVVIGVGVGGVAVERSVAEPNVPAVGVQAVDESAVDPRAGAPKAHAVAPSSVEPSVSAERTRPVRPRALAAGAHPGGSSVVSTARSPRTGEPKGNPEPPGNTAPAVPELPADLPAVPPLPEVEPPTDLLPPLPSTSVPPQIVVPPLPDDLPQPPLPLPTEGIALPGISLP